MEQPKRKALKNLPSKAKILKWEENSKPENLPPNSKSEKPVESEENNSRYHRLETLVSIKSRRWNRNSEGREMLLQDILERDGTVFYGPRRVIAWHDGHEWQKLTKASLYALYHLLLSGKFAKVAMLDKGNPTGEDENGDESS